MEGGKSSKMSRGPFFFAFHFSKWQKLVLGVPKWKFSTGKKGFHGGKKIRKNDFAPSEKISCYAPVFYASFYSINQEAWANLSTHQNNAHILFTVTKICRMRKLQPMYMSKWWHCMNIYTRENIHIYYTGCVHPKRKYKQNLSNPLVYINVRQNYLETVTLRLKLCFSVKSITI